MLVPKTYDLLDRCVCDGIEMGYKRAFKHTDSLKEELVKEHIHREIMNEICTWFNIINEKTEREWQGLTDEDIGLVSDEFLEGVLWAEARLKEKNHV